MEERRKVKGWLTCVRHQFVNGQVESIRHAILLSYAIRLILPGVTVKMSTMLSLRIRSSENLRAYRRSTSEIGEDGVVVRINSKRREGLVGEDRIADVASGFHMF